MPNRKDKMNHQENFGREFEATSAGKMPRRLSRGVASGLLALAVFALGLWFVCQTWFQTRDVLMPTGTLTPLPTELTDGKGVNMRLVPQGAFTMGAKADDAVAECVKLSQPGSCLATYTDEEPRHQVYLDAYYMDMYEVTNALYKACVDAGWGCTPPGHNEPSENFSDHYGDSQFDAYPMVDVTWNQAETFCKWRGARLPTEAEWEKAARGTDARTYPWGNTFDGVKTNFCDKNCQGVPNPNYDDGYAEAAPVGSHPQDVSPYGIYDLAGNVDEWTADWYDENYYRNSPTRNPQGPSFGRYGVQRGGSWRYGGSVARSSARYWDTPDNISDASGFRCARSAP
jgi:formylglycine-generating enzyme required for sulfatase activity